jgi:hypothetical protein
LGDIYVNCNKVEEKEEGKGEERGYEGRVKSMERNTG